VYRLFRCKRFTLSQLKRSSFGFNKGAKWQPKALWSGNTGLSGVHRTVSGAPPDSIRCTRGLQLELATFGIFQRLSRYNSPDCPVYTGQCPVHHRTVSGAPEDSNLNSPPSGFSRGSRAIIHRTVRCTPDSVRCAKEDRPQELASFGKRQWLVR
jgi:hypothetical protein